MIAVPGRRTLEVLVVVITASIFALAVLPAEHTPPAGSPGLAEAALPLDDAYIFLRFAQQIARGHGLEWSDGVGSSGATSLALLPLLLPGQLAADLTTQVLWSRAVGWVTLILFGLAALRLLRALDLPDPVPLLGAAAIVLSGPTGWGALGGMESALNAAAIFLACALWTEVARPDGESDVRRLAWTALVTGLLPLARPENLLLAGVGCLAVTLLGTFRGHRWLATLTLAPGAGLALLNVLLTGNPKPAGALAKSITEFAYLDLSTMRALYDLNLGGKLLPAYLGQRGALLWPPVGWIALGMAVALPLLLLRRRERFRSLAMVGIAWWVLLLAAPLSAMVEWQNMRHHHAGLALAWVLALTGAALAFEGLRRRLDLPGRSRWALVLIPALLLAALPGWRAEYRLQVEDLLLRHGPAAEWLAANAAGRELLLNDAGYLAVRHDGPMIDAIGLGTPVLARPYRHGPGATVEALVRLGRPPAIAAVNLDVFHLELILGEVVGPAPHRETDTTVAAVRTDLLEQTVLVGPGLDFADLESEDRHALDWAPPPHALEPSRLVLVDEGSGPTAHGCRPLRDRLTLAAPPGFNRGSLLVVAPEDGSVELSVGDATTDRRARSIVPAGGWRRLEFPVSGRVSIQRESAAFPCLESIVFSAS